MEGNNQQKSCLESFLADDNSNASFTFANGSFFAQANSNSQQQTVQSIYVDYNGYDCHQEYPQEQVNCYYPTYYYPSPPISYNGGLDGSGRSIYPSVSDGDTVDQFSLSNREFNFGPPQTSSFRYHREGN